MPRTVGCEKRTAQLSGALHRNLSLYALAAGAAGIELFALVQPADAEVVYTSAHEIIGRHQSFAIDLNHDGITDFTIQNQFDQSLFGRYVLARLQAVPAAGGGIVSSSADYGAAALKKGSTIGPPERMRQGPQVMAFRSIEGSFGTYSFGGWFNASNAYLGFGFKINGQVHYGWARLSVSWNHEFRIVAGLTGYAYETEADIPIIAGDTGNRSVEEEGAKPVSERFLERPEASRAATLGTLSLGAPGLSIWRREREIAG